MSTNADDHIFNEDTFNFRFLIRSFYRYRHFDFGCIFIITFAAMRTYSNIIETNIRVVYVGREIN